MKFRYEYVLLQHIIYKSSKCLAECQYSDAKFTFISATC